MLERNMPGIYLLTDIGQKVQIILRDENGTEGLLPKTTPADDLVRAMGTDYSSYRREIQRLRDGHPLLEAKPDVPEADLLDLCAQAFALPEEFLREIDPVAYFVAVQRLTSFIQHSPTADDGSAAFLLESGERVLKILEEPVLTQIRLRNIFEIAFDNLERGTQRERYAALKGAFPTALDNFFFCRRTESESETSLPLGGGFEYTLRSPYDLYLLELNLYFQQDKQRIARCEYCWGYFVPATKKETLYCDREFDSKTCKQLGPNLKRKVGPELDGALRIYDQLRARMAQRLNRYELAAEWKRSNLFPMDATQYSAWLDLAHAARMDYLAGRLTAPEFLRRIDVYRDLDSYDAEEAKLYDPKDTAWRQRVVHNIDFDPALAYQPMMCLDLGQGADAQWQYFSAEDLARQDRDGAASLREKYGRDGSAT